MQAQNQNRDGKVLKSLWRVAVLAVILLLSIACNQNSGKKAMENQKEQTITFGVGRFVIDIPVSMQYRGGTYRMRDRSIEEVMWPDADKDKESETLWNTHIEGIKKLKAPNGFENALIEIKDIENIGKSCRAVLFFNEPLDTAYGTLHIFLDSGSTAVWIKARDKKIASKDFTYQKSTDLAKAYRPPSHRLGKADVLTNRDSFYLEHGAVDLPFEYKESVDLGFQGHAIDKHLELSIETEVVHEVEQSGLIERFKAVIATNYAPGLKIDKIKTGSRTVAGMEGEEIIYRGTEDDGEVEISFVWEHPGVAKNAHLPNVIIDMATTDGQFDEKLAVWDTILDSMRPAGR